MDDAKPCAKCERRPRLAGIQFCRHCRDDVLARLGKSGYLEKTRRLYPRARSPDARESQQETRGKLDDQ